MRWRQYGITRLLALLLIAVLPGPLVVGAEQAPSEATAPAVGALAPDTVGLLPVVQMGLLSLLSVLLASRLAPAPETLSRHR
jgi:hypothetical protein